MHTLRCRAALKWKWGEPSVAPSQQLQCCESKPASFGVSSPPLFFFFKGSILVQFQCRWALHDTVARQRQWDDSDAEVENGLKWSGCRRALNQSGTYRSTNDQSVASNGDGEKGVGGGGREGGAADGSVMPGSNAIHFSIIRLRHDPRHHLSPPCRLPAPHICSAGRSTSTPESPSDRLPVFPSQLCVEAPHLPEGRCLAAPLSLARPINSFNSAPWRPTPRFALLSCPQSWVGGGGCRDRGGC